MKTANSGYLTRRLVDVSQDCIIVELDCGTEQGLTVSEVLEGGEVIVPLSERLLGRTAAVDIVDPVGGGVVAKAGEEIDEDGCDRVENAGVESVLIRSVLTCESRRGVCATCYGRDLARGTPVNMGEAVGVIAAQSIGEPGTQLTMRTFHIGGTAQLAEQSSVDVAYAGTIKINNRNVIEDSAGRLVVMGRSLEICLVDDKGREKASHRVPYGARLLFDEGAGVSKGDKLLEWDPYTIPIITEREGIVTFSDLVEGVSMREYVDEATGIANKVVIDWRQQPKGAELRPRITLRDKKGEVVTLANDMEARYFLSVDAILSVEDGAEVRAGDVLARIPRESTKTRDITGGLPRVAELFEARIPKDLAVMSEIAGTVEYGKDYKAKRRIVVRPEDGGDPAEYLVAKGKHISVREGDLVEKGDLLLDGNPVPHDILRILGVEALARYLIAEIQEVYRLQGVKINDKHIEVIARQMLQKVEIVNPAETTFLLGEQVDRIEFDEANAQAVAEGREPATSVAVLLGITKASLQTGSFISAASFQETTRVLTEAAVSGRVDGLVGLKENVIVGRLIPAGTGNAINRFKEIASERDHEIEAAIEAQREAERSAEEAERAAAEADEATSVA